MTKRNTILNLCLSKVPECDRKEEPVSSGIPWPKGVLRTGDRLELSDIRGKKLPLQARALAFWPDGSVKWSLLSTRIDARRGRQAKLRISQVIGSGEPVLGPHSRTAPAKSLNIIEHPSRFIIDTGRMRLSIDRKNGGLISDMQILGGNGRWRKMLQGRGMGIYVNRCDPDGKKLEAFTNGPDNDPDRRTRPLPPKGFRNNAFDPKYDVSIVEQGPLRIVLRISGTHIGRGGRRFCPFILHLILHNDSTRIDIQHTLVYTGIPSRDLIAGFGLKIPLLLGKESPSVYFADDQGAAVLSEIQATRAHPIWKRNRLTQMLADGYIAEKWTGPDCGRVKIIEGRRNPGWIHFGDSNAGCTACVRDFWRQCPKGFGTDSETGELTIGLWPDNAPPWDLRRYSHSFHPDLYEYSRPDLWPEFPEETHGARGISKTHEISLVFAGGPQGIAEMEQRGQSLADPLFLIAEPEWYCGSGAIGKVAPTDPGRFEKVEKVFKEYTDFILAEQETRRWYGMVDYGDFQMTYAREDYNAPREKCPAAANRRRWLHDVGGHSWINTEARPDQWLWLAFFRTGRCDCLRAASAMSRHNRDIDCYHWGNFKGSGSRHNVNHWGCADKEWRVSMPISLRWHYYLTGDPWTCETIMDTIANCQRYRDIATSLAPTGTSALSGLMVKSEISGCEEDFEAVSRMADIYAGALRKNGSFANRMKVDLMTGKGEIVGDGDMEDKIFFLLGFGAMQTLVEVAELTGHRLLTDTLVRFAESRIGRKYDWIKSSPGAAALSDIYHLQLYSLAWRKTRDQRYIGLIRRCLGNIRAELLTKETKIAGARTGKIKVPCEGRKQTCHYGDVCTQISFGLAAILEERQ